MSTANHRHFYDENLLASNPDKKVHVEGVQERNFPSCLENSNPTRRKFSNCQTASSQRSSGHKEVFVNEECGEGDEEQQLQCGGEEGG